MEEKLMDIHGVATMLSMHPKSVRKLMKEDTYFPNPIVFSERVKRWKYSEILEWIDSKHETDIRESG